MAWLGIAGKGEAIDLNNYLLPGLLIQLPPHITDYEDVV